MNKHQPHNRIALTGVSLFAYMVTGFVYTVIGPCLPWMGERYGVDVGAQGLVFSFMFGGCFTALISGILFADYLGEKVILTTGSLLMGAGLLIVGSAPEWRVALGGFLVIGLGLGCIDVGANALVSRVNPRSTARHLGMLHALFSVGAVSGPYLAGFLMVRTGGYGMVYYSIAPLAAVCAGLCVYLKFPPQTPGRKINVRALTGALSHWRYALLCIILMLCNGTEMVFNGWASTYFKEVLSSGVFMSSAATSIFWSGILAGRVMSSIIVDRIGAARLLMISILGCVVTIPGFVSMAGEAPASVLLFMVGFCFSSMFPLIIALGTEKMEGATAAAAGGLFALAGIGGIILPACVGLFSEATSLRAGLLICTPLVLLMAPLLSVANRNHR